MMHYLMLYRKYGYRIYYSFKHHRSIHIKEILIQKYLNPWSSKIIFPYCFSGKEIGKINNSVKKATGLQNISVVAVAGHDTASTVLAVPAENENFAYLSSGTWSLMGIESKEPVINRRDLFS